ncbi:MAG TPA: phosphate acyltransferase PlsX [Armatimonadetes bacterium]|nr:phosphate acyltransferase PlsX [Armatimonadota bacterium]
MSRVVRIAVDVMGADHGPEPILEGVRRALMLHRDNLFVVLVGHKDTIARYMHQLRDSDGELAVDIHHADTLIEMSEPPLAIRRKPNSSIVIAMQLLSAGEVDAVVTPGNTGAALTAGTLFVGRLSNVERPAIAALIPRPHCPIVLIDAGANVDCRPWHLMQFAVMGSTYAETILNISSPRIGLLNIGEEPSKGDEATKEAYELLSHSQLNFVGNVEGRDILFDKADVIVTDGFTGNVVLKTLEGCGQLVYRELRHQFARSWWRRAVAGLLLRQLFNELREWMDWREFGGAPLLGLRKLCIIGHGASDSRAIERAICIAHNAVRNNLMERISEGLQHMHALMASA